MTHVRVCIDEKVVVDDDLDVWRATPLDYFKDLVRSDVKPEPWLKAIMVVMADAVMTGQSVNITANTGGNRWLMEVVRT